VGTGIMTVALWLLSRVTMETGMPALLGLMLLLGLGLGLVMQVLVIAVQNAVDYRDLGVATSGNTLFRSVGGSVGTAVLGAVFAARLAAHLAERFPGASGGEAGLGLGMEAIAQLPPAARAGYLASFTASFDTVFLVAASIAFLGFVLSWLVPERPLRETISATTADVGHEVASAMSMPRAPEPQEVLLRGLSAVMDRDLRRHHVERIVARAGVDVSAAAAWLLLRLDEQPDARLEDLERRAPFDRETVHRGAQELRARALATETSRDGVQAWRVTPEGCGVLAKVVTARRAHLAEVFAEWSPERQQELAVLMRRLAGELVPDARAGGG